MNSIKFKTGGGKLIEIVKDIDNLSNDSDFFIYYKDRYDVHERLEELLDSYNEKSVTKDIAEILLKEKLLWQNPPF